MVRPLKYKKECVRGILSTDLFKLFGNDLLDRLKIRGIGSHIGDISCIAPTCTDDIVIASDRRDTLQTLLNIAVNYSFQEHYLLQPVKSVLLELFPTHRGKILR